jgi:hypothetical protein
MIEDHNKKMQSNNFIAIKVLKVDISQRSINYKIK